MSTTKFKRVKVQLNLWGQTVNTRLRWLGTCQKGNSSHGYNISLWYGKNPLRKVGDFEPAMDYSK